MAKATIGKKSERQAAGPPAEAAPAQDAVAPRAAALGPAHERFGWLLLAVGVAFGTFVESLLGFKSASFLLDPIRRELWTMAHFHAAFLGLANLVYARFADGGGVPERARRSISRALRAGSLLLPLGFLLGGVRHFEGDPGVGILLVPVGALLVVAAAIARAVYAHRG